MAGALNLSWVNQLLVTIDNPAATIDVLLSVELIVRGTTAPWRGEAGSS